MSEQKQDETISHLTVEESSPPPSPPTPASVHPPSVSLTLDSQMQAALAVLRQQQDEDQAEQRALLSQLLASQQQMLSRIQALDARNAVTHPPVPDLTSAIPIAGQSPVANPLGINPALLATPATVRLGQSADSSTFPPHSVNPPVARVLFANAADRPSQPPRPNSDEEKGWDKWVQDARKTVKIDPFKGGGQEERRNIRTWVTSLSMQLDLIAGPRGAEGRVDADRLQLEQARVATTYLQDGALDWAIMYQQQCKAAGLPVRWDQMSFALMAKYEGQDHGMLRQQELASLTYKRGRCTDLPKYEAEFDRLALLVHGSNMQIPAIDNVLGQMFASGIQRGDMELYKDMWPNGTPMPQSLRDWKSRAESAIVRAQAFKLVSSTNSRPSAGQVAANNMEASDEHKSATPEQSPTSSTLPASLDMAGLVKLLTAMQTKNSNRRPQTKKYQLTAEERTKLYAAKRCFCCFKVGHNARDCSQKATLPTRAPNADELKA